MVGTDKDTARMFLKKEMKDEIVEVKTWRMH
jgi:hypothetical protein